MSLTVRDLAEAKDRHGGHERRPEGGADERERRPHAAGFNQARAQESAVRDLGKRYQIKPFRAFAKKIGHFNCLAAKNAAVLVPSCVSLPMQ